MSKGAPFLVARKGIEVSFGLVTFAVLAHTLTKTQFAIYSLIFAFLAIARLTSFPGLGSAMAQAVARGRLGGFRRAQSISFLGAMIGSAILLGVAWWHFDGVTSEVGEAFIIAALCFPLFAGITFWKPALIGAERYGRLLWFDGFGPALKCGAIVACAFLFPGLLYPIVIAALLAPAAVNIIATWDILRILPKDAAREEGGIKYGLRISLYQLPAVIAAQLDKIVLFYFIAPEALAVYAVALRIPELARAVVGAINTTLAPVFARAESYTPEISRFSWKLWLLYMGISVLGAIFVIPWLLPLLSGPAYSDAVFFAQIMTIGVAFSYLSNIQFRFIRSRLDSAMYLKATLASALIDSVLILGLAFLFGLSGVIAAYILKGLIRSLFIERMMVKKYLQPADARR